MRIAIATIRAVLLYAAIVGAQSIPGIAHAQVTLSPLTTFGSNGWIAPGSNSYVSTGNNNRGLGWNPVTKNLVLAPPTAELIR